MNLVLFGAIYDALPLIPLAVALVWTLRYQQVADLSLAGSFAISAGVSVSMLASGSGAISSVLVGVLVGLSIGLLMSFTVNTLRVDPLMSGLVVLFISYALSLGITQGTIPVPSQVNPLEAVLSLERSGNSPVWLHPFLNLVFLAIGGTCIQVSRVLLRSEWGCGFRALEDLDNGKRLLQSLGLLPWRLSTVGFLMAAALASISGISIALRDGQATSSLGLDSLIEIIPAYLLGVSLFEKRPFLQYGWKEGDRGAAIGIRELFGSAIRFFRFASAPTAAGLGVVLFFLVVNLAQRWTGAPWLPRVVIGATILAILGVHPALEALRRYRRQREATNLLPPGGTLNIKGLTVTYPTVNGPLEVLHEVNLSARPGEIVALKGPNGCGKTTLLRALAEHIDCRGIFELPTQMIDHGIVRKTSRSQFVAYVPQDASSCTAGSLSIAEHAALTACVPHPSLLRCWKKRAATVMPLLGVTDVAHDPTALVSWLSGGQTRRVLIGLLKVRYDKPIVVALDEPFSHLDARGRLQCVQAIEEFAQAGHVVIIVDHGANIIPTRHFTDHWSNSDCDDN